MDCMAERDLLFGEITRERASQDEEWGGAEHDDSHEHGDWVRFIEKQCRLARTAGNYILDYRKESQCKNRITMN